jgi:hypothetical protein
VTTIFTSDSKVIADHIARGAMDAVEKSWDWDPPEAEKEFFRHRMYGGDVGWKARRGGREVIILNRPNENPRPYYAHDWIPERPPALLTLAGCAKITFEADKALCVGLCMYERARRDWLNMTEPARIAWMKHGPAKAEEKHRDVRVALYRAIMEKLEPLTR